MRPLSVILIMLAILTMSVKVFDVKAARAAEAVYFSPSDIKTKPALPGRDFSDRDLERKKIHLLIGFVRISPYTFIRNGDEYSAQEAAAHLSRKYLYAYDRIRTAREFIEYIGSESSLSGRPYEVETPDGIRYATRDIFYNELELLESDLAQMKLAKDIPIGSQPGS